MKVLECKNIDIENYSNIKFVRIDPEDLSITIRDIIISFSNMAWISKFDQEYIRKSFTKRASESAIYLTEKIIGN